MSHYLIVDDLEENRYLLEFALKQAGHQVTVATNGAEALAKARQSPPDLVVSDILMPVMDGFTLCRQWRADEKLKRIPFIFYTSTYTAAEDEKLALNLGADAFIIKPKEMIELLSELAKLLSAGVIKRAPREPARDELGVMKEYNSILVQKLEKKLFELEQARERADTESAERKEAEDRGRRLYEETERARQALLSILEDQRAAESRIREQIDELRRWQLVTSGREDRVITLKQEVNGLLAQLNKPPRYAATEPEHPASSSPSP